MPYFQDPANELFEAQEDLRQAHRRNRSGDDLITKVVFVLIVIALLAWFVRFWIAGHSGMVTHL